MKKVLIIEDDEFLRGLLAKKLLTAGFEVSESVDGEKGIAEIKEQSPDLVLLDLLLPNIDGFEVLSKIKADKSTSFIPVVILSNMDEKESVERGLKLGAVEYIIKSQFTPEEILEKVKKILA